MLDGAIRIDDLIRQAQTFGMPAVAITDHGAMYGALEFYDKAGKAGIKPLVGCEFYVAKNRMEDHSGRNFHLVALAMNADGYGNLMKLASLAQTRGFHYRPRIDRETLYRHQEGLIVLSACLQGELPWLLTHNDPTGARNRALELQQVFGDRLYLEIQENGIPEQSVANQGILALADELGLKVVATNDCHYLTHAESYAHEVLLCIQTGKTIDDPTRFRFSTDQLYFKSGDEMAAQFSYCPEAVTNTLEVAERCDLKLSFGSHHFPVFPVPEGETLDDVFTAACWAGLKRRLEHSTMGHIDPETETAYRDRLGHEIEVIRKMGFSGYFLIVADFINWAKEQAIPVGPGRGSGAGSLAAFCLAITDIDPLPYGLLFERFLNVERVSMPDFDVDFCKERRDEVLRYVHDRYGGDDYVAQIVAYGSMKARAVVRDVGRVLDIPLPEVDRIAKLIPDQLKVTIKKAIEEEPRLREAMNDPQVRELLTISQSLEGLARHKSTHAAGVVISPRPLVEFLPVCIGPNKEILTQYDMKYVEKTGLIKFDFLGLKTLTVIDRALKLIKFDRGDAIDLSRIPMDDPATYALLCRGDTMGIFQLESDGMRNLVVRIQPEQFTDLIALVALYRPGPLESGMVDDFVETKHGRRQANYPLPQIKPVLEETYGVIVYQEQVMKISNILAGYSLGDADLLRRAMGKKIPEDMEKERGKFMAGAKAQGVPEDKAEYIFDLMAKFAGYGFNKSHSAAYALVAYQTAYLKAHYPAQFLAALLSCDVDNTDKVVKYINECREQKIEVLPPDINESFKDFTVIGDRIRFGLAAVKNVGGAALESILAEREEKGGYRSLSDFCNRIDSSKANRKVVESLIKAGAFDSMGGRRAQYMEILDLCIDRAKSVQRDRLSGQMNLFAVGKPADQAAEALEVELPPEIDEWPNLERLGYEKEAVGFFLTGHPLEGIWEEMRRIVDTDIAGVEKLREGHLVRVGGLIAGYRDHKSKKGERMAFTVLEDMSSRIELVVFPSTFAECAELLVSDQPLVVLGMVQQSERGPKLVAQEVHTLETALERYAEQVVITLQADATSVQHMQEIKEVLYQHHGATPIVLTLHFPNRGEVDIEVLKDMSVRPSAKLFRRITTLCGNRSLAVRMRTPERKPRRKGNGNWQERWKEA